MMDLYMKLLNSKLVKWHMGKIDWAKERYNLSEYEFIWGAWIEGILIGLFLGWWLL